MNKPVIDIGLGHSLDKYFTDSEVPGQAELELSGLRGEVLAFQVVYRSPSRGEIDMAFSGPLSEWAYARRIDLAHVEHPTYNVPPETLIGRAPGFYPDPLVPEEEYRTFPNQTRGIWVTIEIPCDARAGRRALNICITTQGRDQVD